MEAIKQIVRIPKDHEIRIKIPQYIPENEVVEVILIIKKNSDNFKQKISELKEAMKDELFLDYLREISEDFKAVDLERWE
jgi:mannitol/fructose-specific phosphotransferase system IIA component (Ntr-type)